MNALVLVRHSLPEIDPARPVNQWGLSAEGRARCIHLSERLTVFQPGAIISSVESKARETAEILARSFHLPVFSVEGLHEHERGNEPFLNSPEQFRSKIKELFLYPNTLVYGMETASQALARYANAVHKVVAEHPEQDILLVSHGAVMSLFVAFYNPISGYELWKSLKMPDRVVLSLPSFSLSHLKL